MSEKRAMRMRRSGKAVVYDGLRDAMIIMQSIPYGMPEQSILLTEFAHKETDGRAIFEIAQDGNQILVNGETVHALCSALKELLKRSEEDNRGEETCRYEDNGAFIRNPHTKDSWSKRDSLIYCMTCGKKIETYPAMYK
jgi:hypothetical protein